MIKTPCEVVKWDLLPAIRKELVRAMAAKGIKRKEIARAMGITQAAVCNYLKFKRGENFKFPKPIAKQIEISADIILKAKLKEEVIYELCRICCLLRKKGFFCKLHKKESPGLGKCKLYELLGCFGEQKQK